MDIFGVKLSERKLSVREQDFLHIFSINTIAIDLPGVLILICF